MTELPDGLKYADVPSAELSAESPLGQPLHLNLGMFPLILTVLNRDSGTPNYNP